LVLVLFASTLFVSAFLSFSVQPLIGKALLPTVGGAASVWVTSLVFFQAALLLGYAAAHGLGKLPTRVQFAAYVVLLGAAGVVLPFGIQQSELIPAGSEALWVIGRLVATVGAPFAVLSACAPLLQRWYAIRSDNPYFLYAASNAGSLVGLLAYPLLAEPLMGLEAQGIVWAVGYVIAALLVAGCGAWRAFGTRPAETGDSTADGAAGSVGVTASEVAPPASEAQPDPEAQLSDDDAQVRPLHPALLRLVWIGLAAAPSALLVAVTNHVTTDLAPVPLLWVPPLALFLLSVIVAFGRTHSLPNWTARALGVGSVFVLAATLAEANRPAWLLLGAHLGVFFLASLRLHRELYERRPASADLTEFYLWMALGGVLGGASVALVAPASLPASWEYPVLIGLVFFAFPNWGRPPPKLLTMPVWAVPIVAAVAALIAARIGASYSGPVGNAITFLPPAIVAVNLVGQPRRFAMAMVAIAVVGLGVLPTPYGTVVTSHRNFHSTLRVVDEPGDRYRALVDGTTLHGRVPIDAEACTPLTYFHPTGPAGETLRRRPARGPVGVVGLGVGSLACYAGEEPWTFFELNPSVVEVATDEALFGHVAKAVNRTEIVLGDARVQIGAQPDGHFDILVVDAFSSDAIPTHLLTREAFALYRRKLRPNGIVLINLSSRFLDLPPVVAAAAGSKVWGRTDPQGDVAGKSTSSWVVVWRDSAPPSPWPGWDVIPADRAPWTDDRSSILPHLIVQ
jgi:hypothetical protein